MNRYSSFKPGKVWVDTAGKPIQAHGFSVFFNEKDKKYYWYGENKEKTKGGMFNKVWHWGVRCYTSKDLYNWEDRGLIIPPQPDNLQSPLHPTYCMDRPHVLYCDKTKKFVAWLKTGMERHFKDYKPDHTPRKGCTPAGDRAEAPGKHGKIPLCVIWEA